MKKNFSKIVIVTLAVLIAISSVSLGKVFAYFSAKSSASGTVTMGHLSISDIQKNDGTDINWDITNLQPNQSFGGSYKVDVTSNINYYIRILFKASVTPLTGKSHATNCGDEVTDDTDILNIAIDGAYTKSDTKTTDGYTAYYKLSPRTVTSATTTETFSVDLKAQNWVGSGSCDYYMGATVLINMQVQVMQADYLESQSAGGTIASASTMHSLWKLAIGESYQVTITCTEGYYSSPSVYYACDGETSWHSIDEFGTTVINVKGKLIISNNTSYNPNWDAQAGELVVEDYNGFVVDTMSRYYLDGQHLGDCSDPKRHYILFNITQNCEIEVVQDMFFD